MRATLTPMVILLLMTSLSSCDLNKIVDFNQEPLGSRSPAFSVETQGKAIAACIKMKEEEYDWKYDEIIAYCAEQWRNYITFIEENKDVEKRRSN